MGSIKKIVFILFILSSLTAGCWAYFYLKNSKKPKVEAISVLPDSCLVYINTHDFFELNRKINSQSLIADKLKLLAEINTACEVLKQFDSLFASYDIVNEQIADNVIHLALYGKNQDWLSSFNIKQLGNQNAISEGFVKILRAQSLQNELFSFEWQRDKKIYFSFKQGVGVFSNSVKLIKKSLDADLPKFENSSSYKEYKSTLSENNICSIYINHFLYSQSEAPKRLNLSQVCKKAFSAGEVDIQPSELRVNGYMGVDSTEILSALVNQQAQPTEDLPNLPYNTFSFYSYGFDSFTKIQSKLKEKIAGENSLFWKEVNEAAMYNVELEFNNNIQHHLLCFKTRLSPFETACIPLNDTAKTLEHLGFMSDTVILDSDFKVYRLKTALPLFAPWFDFKTAFAALYETSIFFCEDKQELIRVLLSYKNKQYLSDDKSYNNYKNEHFVDEYNYLFYCAPALAERAELLTNFFGFKPNTAKNPFENLKHFSYSLSNGSRNFKFRLQLLNEASAENKEQNVLWATKMDTVCKMSAFNFVNHLTGENELVIQDEGRQLYLLNAKGTILWKKKLSEQIVSTIHMVDAFKNNKYQLLFNSKNYLHLVDRNGNYVEGFPVKLPSEAASELTIFDYDSNRDYRIFISCKNNTIYNYSIKGTKQEGFVPVITENNVNLPLQYAKVGQSDYIVAVDNEGKIYTFGRKGQGRIGLKNRTIANCPAFYVDATNNINSTYIAYLDDKSALINKISFSDRKEIIKVEQETQNAAVSFGLIDENRSMDFIVTKDNRILIYDLNGDLLFEKELKGNLYKTGFYADESHSLFYSLNQEDREMVIYDQIKQNSYSVKTEAMPLINKLFKDNKKYLILTYNNQLSCLPLN